MNLYIDAAGRLGNFYAVSGGGSGQLGVLTAAVANFAMGSGPPFAATSTLTLTQTGAQYGFARITMTGHTSNFALVSIEGQTLYTPVPMSDPSIHDLLAVAWGDGTTDPKSVDLTFVGIGVLGTYSLDLDVSDVDGNVVLSATLTATIADSFLSAVELLPSAVMLYSPQDLTIGALSASDVTMEDIIGSAADATYASAASDGEIKATSLLSPSLSKSLTRPAGAAAVALESRGDPHVYGKLETPISLTTPHGTAGTWFFVIESGLYGVDPGWNGCPILLVDNHSTWSYISGYGWGSAYHESRNFRILNPHTASPSLGYMAVNYANQMTTGTVTRPAHDYFTIAVTIDSSKDCRIYFGAVGDTSTIQVDGPHQITGYGSPFDFGPLTPINLGHTQTPANYGGASLLAAAGFDVVLTAVELQTLHDAVA